MAIIPTIDKGLKIVDGGVKDFSRLFFESFASIGSLAGRGMAAYNEYDNIRSFIQLGKEKVRYEKENMGKIRDIYEAARMVKKGSLVFRNMTDDSTVSTFTFQYNPSQFAKDVSIVFNSELVPGGTSSNISYIGISGARTSFELFLYKELSDSKYYIINLRRGRAPGPETVQDKINILEQKLIPTQKFAPPPYVWFVFGPSIKFKGYIDGYRVEYLQFDKDLNVIMARISLSLLFADIKKPRAASKAQNTKSNEDIAKEAIVKKAYTGGWVATSIRKLDAIKIFKWEQLIANLGDINSYDFRMDADVIAGHNGRKYKQNAPIIFYTMYPDEAHYIVAAFRNIRELVSDKETLSRFDFRKKVKTRDEHLDAVFEVPGLGAWKSGKLDTTNITIGL